VVVTRKDLVVGSRTNREKASGNDPPVGPIVVALRTNENVVPSVMLVRYSLKKSAGNASVSVTVPGRGRNLAVPLSQLIAIDPDEETAEAIGDWHYWVAQGYLF
jgi:hypothetical protein